MSENTQHKIDGVRPPRVQITYDVVVGESIEMKELPFVVGIMADLSGMSSENQQKMKEKNLLKSIDKISTISWLLLTPSFLYVQRIDF